METQRNLLTMSLLAICAILYFKWIDFTAVQNAAQNPVQIESEVPNVVDPLSNENLNTDVASVPQANDIAVPQADELSQTSELITVTTDMVVATINPVGGVIQRLELREHPENIEEPNIGFALLKKDQGETFITEDGLTAVGGHAPNHLKQYEFAQTSYEMGGAESVTVPLTWVSESGVKFVKTLTFKRNDYVVDINHAYFP